MNALMAHSNKEQQRLKALQEYNVLDTLPEKSFDEISKLASIICETPVSYISFIDSDRQWFKSKQGFNLKQTPRSISFCNHTIETQDGRMIIEDARKDPRFNTNPMVHESVGYVFYAGVCIVDENDNALGTLCVIDNKSRKLTKKQLLSLEALSGQVLQLLKLHKKNNELNEALKATEEHNRSLERFAYVAAHDIKSPLANISNLLELLDFDCKQKLAAHEQEYLHHAKTSALSLNNFIRGLLDYNRIDTVVKQQKESFSVNGLISRLRSDYQGKKPLNFNLSLKDDTVCTVQIAIEQILRNLIDNAVKFCDKESCEITFTSWNKDAHIWIRVHDNGPGFPESNKESLFELFTVGANQKNQEVHSSGIGLATVKRLVKHLDGEISVSNAPNGGCMFDFSFISQ